MQIKLGECVLETYWFQDTAVCTSDIKEALSCSSAPFANVGRDQTMRTLDFNTYRISGLVGGVIS